MLLGSVFWWNTRWHYKFNKFIKHNTAEFDVQTYYFMCLANCYFLQMVGYLKIRELPTVEMSKLKAEKWTCYHPPYLLECCKKLHVDVARRYYCLNVDAFLFLFSCSCSCSFLFFIFVFCFFIFLFCFVFLFFCFFSSYFLLIVLCRLSSSLF